MDNTILQDISIFAKEKPKLLIVADRYLPKVDGVLGTVNEFIKKSKDDFDISLLVPKFSTAKLQGIKPITLKLTKKLKIFEYPLTKLCFSNLRKTKKAVKNSDIIFLQEYGPNCIMAYWYARRYKKKIALYIHNTPWEFSAAYFNLSQRIFTLVTKASEFAMNRMDLIIIPYKEYFKELSEHHIKTKIELTKLGINITKFSPTQNKQQERQNLNLPIHKTILTYVGRFSKEKNLQLIANAMKHLDSKSFHLLLVGDGDKEIKELFKTYENVTMTGFVNNVQDYLKASDIFIMPSRTETTSLATLEAMACAVPVLATKVGFIQSYLKRGYNGEFIPKEEPKILVKKIMKLVQNPSYYRKLSLNARNMVAYQFSWGRSTSKMKKLLKSLI